MLKKIFIKEENGSALVIFTLSFIVILGIAGLVIDLGIVYKEKTHLKKTVNAAVLSGAQELTNNSDSVQSVVDYILQQHSEQDSLKELDIKPNGQYKLRAILERDVPLDFLKIFKMNSIKVSVASTAELAPINRGTGAVPLGIDDSIQLEYFKEYKLKVDSGDSTYGNFGILALSGPGAKLYEEDLTYGYQGELKVGDVIDTQTGNVAGKTGDAINSRIAACTSSVNDFNDRSCPRVVLILVYTPYNIVSNQLKQVKITGFAYFYIKEPVNKNDSSITGYFIKRAGTGYGDKNIEDNGAYAIRLTE